MKNIIVVVVDLMAVRKKGMRKKNNVDEKNTTGNYI
jgi:hypothetical protein